MLLEDYFKSGPSGVEDAGGRGGSPVPRFRLLDRVPAGAEGVRSCRRALDELHPGGLLAVSLRIDHPSRVARLVSLLALPARRAAAERALARAGATLRGCFGIYPGLESPTLIYQLGSRASEYAEGHLVLGGGRPSPATALYGALGRWAGCDVRLGAVLVIGGKP